jgi:hypothetical protein
MQRTKRLQNRRTYQPRCRDTALHRLVASELEGFITDAAMRGHPLPGFVERTFREFLTCGDPDQGFIHLRCSRCGHDRALAFSCKRRGVCTSCAGRRMNEVAEHIASHVVPPVGVRQWVLTLPYMLRYRLAYDRELVGMVLAGFVRALFSSLRRRAKTRYSLDRSVNLQPGAITFVQRFGGSINLNVHFHTLVLDGVYAIDRGGNRIEFLPLFAPTHEEVLSVLTDAAGRILRRLERRGLREDSPPEEADPLARDNPLLARLYAASVQGRRAQGPLAGRPLARLGQAVEAADPTEITPSSARSAVAAGMSLHAGVFVPGTDRKRLERICRYTARPALACERLEELDDGRIAYALRNSWNDGTTHVVFDPRELMARLAAQIPPPNAHQVRYHGILAPAAAWRDKVVPRVFDDADARKPPVPLRRRPTWATLLKKTFAVDALVCLRCGGRMRPIAVVTRLDEIDAPLKALAERRPP